MTSLGMEMLHDVLRDVVAADYLVCELLWFQRSHRVMPARQEWRLRALFPRLTAEGVARLVQLMRRLEHPAAVGPEWMHHADAYEQVLLVAVEYVAPTMTIRVT